MEVDMGLWDHAGGRSFIRAHEVAGMEIMLVHWGSTDGMEKMGKLTLRRLSVGIDSAWRLGTLS